MSATARVVYHKQLPGHDPTPMLHELFQAAACLHGPKTAVVGHDSRLTYERLEIEALLLAGKLNDLGVRSGDRVAMLLPNSLEAAVTIWAVLAAGGVLVPLHAAPRTSHHDVDLRVAEPT
jgi:long-chain acyl-CoA synthetase